MAAFFDHYWWAIFLFLIFVAAFVLRPASPRRHPAPRGADAGRVDRPDR